MVTTVYTSSVTTLNIGSAAGATTLLNAGVLTSLPVGGVLASLATPNAYSSTSGPILVAPGFITWQASAANTGQIQVFIGWVPLAAGAQIS
jgi:hypothetical protein